MVPRQGKKIVGILRMFLWEEDEVAESPQQHDVEAGAMKRLASRRKGSTESFL